MFIHEFYSNIHGIDTSIPQFAMTFRGTCIILTQDLISEITHIPRVLHLDYPGCQRLRIVPKDELLSHFCETPYVWGEHQNTPCSSFVKGSRFLNMVMTFVLTPLSYYNFIIEPRAQFLLSLLEDHFIDFLLILSLPSLMFIRIRRPVISSFFLQLSYRLFAIFLSLFLILPTSLLQVPSAQLLFDRVRPSFDRSDHRQDD